jgi:ADP-glucose pyrophosphorylase
MWERGKYSFGLDVLLSFSAMTCRCTIQNSVICLGAVVENNCNLNKCYVGANGKVSIGSKLENESL